MQAIDLLGSMLPAPSLASSSERGIAVGAWKGAGAPTADQGEQQGWLSVPQAQEMLGSMRSMLALKEAGNRWVLAPQALLQTLSKAQGEPGAHLHGIAQGARCQEDVMLSTMQQASA